jgi:hypothetical protein
MKDKLFFLGGSTPDGFRSAFDDVIADTSYHTYIIKGGPGTGKSTFMKKIYAAFPDEDRDLFLCSSDPDSADAVVLHSHKVIFVDGTAPHVYDPEYPGAVQEILNLGECWDGDKLQSEKENVISATAEYSGYHIRTRRCLTAASSVLADTKHIAANALSFDKLDGFISRLAKKILPKETSDTEKAEGNIVFRRISAVTPDGYMTLADENDTVYLLSDDYFAGSDYFLRSFADIVRRHGLTAQVSLCGAFDEEHYEHMSIPELGITFLSSNPINNVKSDNAVQVNFMRFYIKNILTSKKTRLSFNETAYTELTDEAVYSLSLARQAHNKLEKFYIDAVDFEKTEKILSEMINKIKG